MRVLCASPFSPQFHLLHNPASSFPRRTPSPPPAAAAAAAATKVIALSSIKACQQKPTPKTPGCNLQRVALSDGEGNINGERSRRWVVVGGLAALFAVGDGDAARALVGPPEGPLVEEFWDNVRRYGLYILTVSTGAIYTVFQPIAELLKTPITAVLVLALLVGGGYLVSQVLSAMVGISDFSYDYGY